MVDYQFLKFIINYCTDEEIKENALLLLDFLKDNSLFQGFNIEVEALDKEVVFLIETLEIVVSYDYLLILYNKGLIEKSIHTESLEDLQEELLNINIQNF